MLQTSYVEEEFSCCLLWLWCLVMCNLEGVIVFCEGLRGLVMWIFFGLEWDSTVCLELYI